MSIVDRTPKDGVPRHSDRSAGDRIRHRQKVREAIRENIGDIIGEESIVGKGQKDRIVKVPIRGVKEYRFVYGDNAPGVGTGGEDVSRGDILEQGDEEDNDPKAGDSPGEDYYETEVTIEELIEIMLEDLNLPELEKKQLKELDVVKKFRKKGYRLKGPRNKLSFQKTAREHLRSIQGHKRAVDQIKSEIEKLRASGKNGEAEKLEKNLQEHLDELAKLREKLGVARKDGWKPITNEDRRYSRTTEKLKKESNAVVLCIMDTSGSMDLDKKYLARSFFFLLVHLFVRRKYRNVEIRFIAHHTEAVEVTEEEFFHKGETGGTFISSGYKKALERIAESYNLDLWNVYVFHCSDGDNFESDNEDAIKAGKELCEVSNLFGYIEIKPSNSYHGSSMKRLFEERIKEANFKAVVIGNKNDIYPRFKELISQDKAKED